MILGPLRPHPDDALTAPGLRCRAWRQNLRQEPESEVLRAVYNVCKSPNIMIQPPACTARWELSLNAHGPGPSSHQKTTGTLERPYVTSRNPILTTSLAPSIKTVSLPRLRAKTSRNVCHVAQCSARPFICSMPYTDTSRIASHRRQQNQGRAFVVSISMRVYTTYIYIHTHIDEINEHRFHRYAAVSVHVGRNI